MPEQFFKVANWPATIPDLRGDDLLSLEAWARQVKDWQEELLRILDHTLATEGAGVGEIIEEIPFPPTRVLFAGAAGQITTDAGFTHQAAVNAGKLLYLNDLTTGGNYAEGLFVQIRYAAGASRDLLNLQSGLAGTTLAERFVVQGDGVTQHSAQVQGYAGTVGAPAFSTLADIHTGFDFPADHAIGVVLGGAEKWRFTAGAMYPITTNQEDVGGASNVVKDVYASRVAHAGGSAAAPSIARTGYLDDGIYWPNDGVMGVSLGGAEVARFKTTGFVLPQSAAPAPGQEGEVAWDTDDDKLLVYDGALAVTVAAKTKSRSFVIVSPVAAHDFPFWKSERAITLTRVDIHVIGGTNWIGALDEWSGATPPVLQTAIDADWTVTPAAGRSDTSFTNAALDAGDWLGIHTTSVSGAVASLCITIRYYEQ